MSETVECLDDVYRIAAASHDNLHGPISLVAPMPGDVQPPQGVKTYETNENPLVDVDGNPSFPDPVRDSDFNTRPAHRGYITMFLNPWQFWKADHFTSGKLEMEAPLAVMMVGGMAADSSQRANIPTLQASSYGDLVMLTTQSLGVEPYSGW